MSSSTAVEVWRGFSHDFSNGKQNVVDGGRLMRCVLDREHDKVSFEVSEATDATGQTVWLPLQGVPSQFVLNAANYYDRPVPAVSHVKKE